MAGKAGKAGMAGKAGKAGNQYLIQELIVSWLEFNTSFVPKILKKKKSDKGSTWILVMSIS